MKGDRGYSIQSELRARTRGMKWYSYSLAFTCWCCLLLCLTAVGERTSGQQIHSWGSLDGGATFGGLPEGLGAHLFIMIVEYNV